MYQIDLNYQIAVEELKREVLPALRSIRGEIDSISFINYGGCGYAGLLLYGYIKKHYPTLDPKIKYYYNECSMRFNGPKTTRVGRRTVYFAPTHCLIQITVKGHQFLIDSLRCYNNHSNDDYLSIPKIENKYTESVTLTRQQLKNSIMYADNWNSMFPAADNSKHLYSVGVNNSIDSKTLEVVKIVTNN